MSHFAKLTLADLPKATENDLRKMRQASKTAFFIMLACTILSFLPYGFLQNNSSAISTADIFAYAFTFGGILISSIFDQQAHNIKKRCRSESEVKKELGQIRWYHILVAALLPYAGLLWGVVNLITKRRRSGVLMLSISAAWILIIAIIMLSSRTGGS